MIVQKLRMPAASVSVMPSSDTVKVVDRPQSKRLEWWAKEGPACDDHERRPDQYATGPRLTMAPLLAHPDDKRTGLATDLWVSAAPAAA
jgi:hypothetical protein